METKDLIIIILIIAIVAVVALLVSISLSGDQNNDNTTNMTNYTDKNNTTNSVNTTTSTQNTESSKSSNSNSDSNYITTDDGTKINLNGLHRIWSDQDMAYIYVDDGGYYPNGYIISEDSNGKISAVKDSRIED